MHLLLAVKLSIEYSEVQAKTPQVLKLANLDDYLHRLGVFESCRLISVEAMHLQN